MLGESSRLLFPRLKYLKNVQFKSHGGANKSSMRLYKLDWSKLEEIRQKDHEKWLLEYWPDRDVPFWSSLPEKYETWVKNLTFAISDDYMKEIVRNAKRGLEEWSMHRSFDTNVREMCLKPAQEHIYIAFYLLADCLYDPETNYYYRNEDGQYAENAMVYKFWDGQTGRGLVWGNAKLDEMKRTIEILEEVFPSSCAAKNIFLKDMKAYAKEKEESLDSALSAKRIRNGTKSVGPDKTEIKHFRVEFKDKDCKGGYTSGTMEAYSFQDVLDKIDQKNGIPIKVQEREKK